jgi:CubicO group peptidase (beta-lactamase class C family)
MSLPRTVELIEAGMAAGLHIGAQLYVSHRGNVIADLALGESRPGVAMTTDTLMLWMSSTKPIAAVAIAQLWEHGLLTLDDPVAKHIPEFGVNGKDRVTIRHLLTHTGGFRGVAQNWKPTPWDQIIARINQSSLEPGWVPGERAGYHIGASWFVLGELVNRISGKQFQDYVREKIFLPLGMNDSWIGMPVEQVRAYGERLGQMPVTESGSAVPHGYWATETGVSLPRPGANGHGPIRELGQFYEAMLDAFSPNPKRSIVLPQTIEAMTARHRVGMMDVTFHHVIDWGLGFIINSYAYARETTPYSYGPHASPRTFGHSGFQSSTGFADPEHGLVVALVFNGTPGEQKHDQRMRAVLTAIYEDVGLG